MKDQDLGFDDPRWVPSAIEFLDSYYLSLSQGRIRNKDEHVRFFLKLLKSCVNNWRLSIELVQRKDNESWNSVFNGIPSKAPRTNIFDGYWELEHLPRRVVLPEYNEKLSNAYWEAQQTIETLGRKVAKRGFGFSGCQSRS